MPDRVSGSSVVYGVVNRVTASVAMPSFLNSRIQMRHVFASAPWAVRPIELGTEPMPWLLQIRVTGPFAFTLLAVWPIGGYGSYTSQTARVIQEVLPILKGPVVLAGDLNAPIPSTMNQHARNAAALAEAGLMSAWTHCRGVAAD